MTIPPFDVIYQHFYGVEKWKDCFVFLETASQVRHAPDRRRIRPDTDKFYRKSADVRFTRAGGAWSADVIPEVSNKKTGSTTAAKPEHVGRRCCHAGNLICPRPRHTDVRAVCARVPLAAECLWLFIPKIVSVTWWNEWTAQL